MKNRRSLGTHDGKFHADEVTACALMLLCDLIDQDKIVRTRDPKLLAECEYVCDVGGVYDPKEKLFDHHQVQYEGPLSGAGMILLYLKDQKMITSDEYQMFNDNLIRGVDAHDNGKFPLIPGLCSYSHVISNFIPIPYDASPAILNGAFLEAVQFSLNHLKRMRERYHYIESCKEIVKKEMEKGRNYLKFEKTIPWMEPFFELGGEKHPAQFVIVPSGDHWNLRGIPPTLADRMNVRVPLPEEWAGLLEKELKESSQIPGAIFCHKGRFISVWETEEDALKALNYILSME